MGYVRYSSQCVTRGHFTHTSSPSSVDTNPRVAQDLDNRPIPSFCLFVFSSQQIFVPLKSITSAVSSKDCVLD